MGKIRSKFGSLAVLAAAFFIGANFTLPVLSYPSNTLWLSLSGVSNGWLTLTLNGTQPGSNYTLLFQPTLTASNWSTVETVTGASNQSWTAISVPLGGQSSVFFEAMMTAAGTTSNLWLELPANTLATPGLLTVVIYNTVAGQPYDVLTNSDLSSPLSWNAEQSVFGAAGNSTTVQVPLNGPALFVRASLGADSSGDELPAWWQLQYFGYVGVDPNAQDPAGDGWSNWQDFEGGYNPTVFHAPPAPQGLTASYNADYTATVSWLPSSGPVTSYTIQRDYYTFGVPPYDASQTFNVSASTATIQDNTPFTNIYYLAGGWGLTVMVSYQIQAHYAGGDSVWSDVAWLESSSSDISLVAGPQGSVYFVARNLPAGTTALRLTRLDEWMETEFGDSPANAISFDIPLSTGTNGLYLIPAEDTTSLPDSYGYAQYDWSGQPVNAKGQGTGQGRQLTMGYCSLAIGSPSPDWIMPPYFDGRVQLKQNLIFLLRAATVDYPFCYNSYNLQWYGCQWAYSITNPAGYAYSGFNNPFDGLNGYVYNGFDVFSPFANNYIYQNFVYSPTNLSGSHPPFYPAYNIGMGHIMTGVGGSYNDSMPMSAGFGLVNPTYQLTPPTVSGTPIAAGLAPDQIQWLATYPLDSPEMWWNGQNMVSYGYLEEIGVTPSYDAGENQWETMASNARNLFGLPFLSVQIAYGNSNNTAIETTTLSAGNQVENIDGYFYPQTAQPQLQTVEYDFWNVNAGYWDTNGNWQALEPLPGENSFSPTNQTGLLIAGVADPSFQVAGYAKLAVLNGYPGVYAYLGQYFDRAYQIDANGNVTANTTGVLSPYGSFFATQPGLVALVTMPDIDTGARGTGIVSCISIALNKSRSGGMDLSWNGPDNTFANNPYVFWANNNYDRFTLDADDQIEYDDDVQIGGDYFTQNTPVPDYNFKDGAGHRVIPCARDLQDFFRLWVCGIDTNLIAKLPAGSTITLNWGDVGSPNTGNPTIDIFAAADPDGGIGYLTNSLTAEIQTDPVICPYIGRLGPGQSIQLNAIQFANGWAGNHFIMCGVSNGTGGLNLTIADASGNVLAQSTSYLQIVDIKQMYERWTIGDMPSIALTTNAVPATEDLPIGASAFQYTQPQDTNTPYILYVHGWNMERWEKDRFAESAFKRLYWQGYHGRFGSFRWPTENGFKGISSLATDPSEKDNFDRSEYTAWQSSVGLLNKLKDLNAEYPGHVYMLAHSMGNIVAGEALRLATQQGLGHLVNTYVASQAAVSAHTYDTNIANYSFNYFPWRSQAVTPNIYGNWFLGNNGGGAGQVVNFYNTNDYALQRSVWQLNQLLKPDQFVLLGGTHWDYSYVGVTNDPPPWNHFQKDASLQIWNEVNFDIVNVLTNRYEVMGLAAESYTTALGATPGVHNVADSIYLGRSTSRIWPVDTTGNNYAAHFWHSAEFRGDYWQQQGYWSELLGSDAFNLK